MNGAATLAEVIAVIREFHGLSERETVVAETRLERDLGITGDDGCELLEELEKRFFISFSDSDGTLREAFGLSHDQFLFHSEGFNPFAMIANWFGFCVENVIPLSVGDLHRVITERQMLNDSSSAV